MKKKHLVSILMLSSLIFSCSDDSNPHTPTFSEWPNEDNTGPSGILTVYTGDITTDHDGQIIENLEIHGVVTVVNSNVTIRNCEIYGNPDNWITVNFYSGIHTYGNVIEDCKVDGNGITTGGITGRNYAVRRCEILHTAQAIKVNNGAAVIEDCYIHDLWGHYPDSHNCGIGTNGESDDTDAMDITLRHNNIIADTTDGMGGASAAICLWGDFGQISNWLIENNRVEVGVDESYYIIAAGNPEKPFPHTSNIRILDNVLVYTERVGRSNGIVFFEDANGNIASGNTWEDTGYAVVPNSTGY